MANPDRRPRPVSIERPRFARRSQSCRHAGFHPVRSAHPGRTKDDRDGQVSWLTGQSRFAPPSRGRNPNACGAMARRLQLQGQPGLSRSHFIPVAGEPVAARCIGCGARPSSIAWSVTPAGAAAPAAACRRFRHATPRCHRPPRAPRRIAPPRPAVADHSALVQQYQPVAVAGGRGKIVEYHDDQRTGAGARREQRHHLDLMAGIERGQRLVHDERGRTRRQRAGQHDARTFTPESSVAIRPRSGSTPVSRIAVSIAVWSAAPIREKGARCGRRPSPTNRSTDNGQCSSCPCGR